MPSNDNGKMKFTVDVELDIRDWVETYDPDYDGPIDLNQTFRDELMHGLVQHFANLTKKFINYDISENTQKINNAINDVLEEAKETVKINISKLFDEMLDKETYIQDMFGDKLTPKATVRELIKKEIYDNITIGRYDYTSLRESIKNIIKDEVTTYKRSIIKDEVAKMFDEEIENYKKEHLSSGGEL